MSNLSELLPAGSGAKVAEFVASGTLASGQTVALKTDGTVEAVASDAISVPQTVGAASVFESASADFTSVAYDSSVQRILVSYRDQGNSNYGTAAVGTVSGSTITFGTPAIFISAAVDSTSTANVSGDGKFVIANKGSGNGRARVATVSGTSVSFGSDATFTTNNIDYASVVYDSANDKIVVVWADGGNTDSSTYVVGTVSGTSISFGTAAVFSASYTTYLAATYDSTNGKIVAAYGIGSLGQAQVGTVSGTSMSWGSAVTYESGNKATVNALAFDSTNGKVFVAYRDGSTVYGKVGTVSGTSISFGARDGLLTSSTHLVQSLAYHTAAQKIIFSCQGSGNDLKALIITISGTYFAKSSEINLTGNPGQDNSSTYDSVNGQVVLAYKGTDSFSVTTGTAKTFTPAYTSSNSTSFIGITNAAISNSATGEVAVQGGVIANASSSVPNAFSIGSGVLLNTAGGTNSEQGAAYDSVNNKIVVVYSASNSYGTVVVGTVSGTSISYGTPVVFNSADTRGGIAIGYDPDQEKIILGYRNQPSTICQGVVGTVSGTSISFGTPVTFDSSSSNGISMAYDTNADKMVFLYLKSGTVPSAIVATISGTTISFGSVVTVSTTSQYARCTFDSGTNKIIMAYGSTSLGRATVGTVSGTSISLGTEATFNSGGVGSALGIGYDPINSKTLIAYRDSGNSSYGSAVVGTVSGTSISFGSEVVFNAATTGDVNVVYNAAKNTSVVLYNDSANSQRATAIQATISGTSVSFGTAVAVNAATSYYIRSAYDTSTGAIVVAYMDNTNGNVGKSNVILLTNALTIGTDYFVQTDGTLTTTSSTVPAGRALSTTSILLEG